MTATELPVTSPHADEAHEQGHPGPKTYVVVAAILGTITLIEVWAYNQPFLKAWLIPLLLILSGVKFATVVGFFMHLKFDNRYFTYLFGFGLLIAAFIIIAFMLLFSTHPLPAHAPPSAPVH